MNRTNLFTLAFASVASTSLLGCSLDVPDLNNPGLDQLQDTPTAASIESACTGLLIVDRADKAVENGYVDILGVLGREAYNFDGADPRYVGELLQGTLQAGSPYGGNFWAGPYVNIRLANIILNGVDKVVDLSAADKSAIKGFAETFDAISLLEVIVTHDTNGAVIDTNRDLTQSLGAIVDAPTTYAEIVRLLEAGATDLAAGGDTFPFALSSGYAGFDTPATFLTFNRAIRARVAVYLKDYTGALTFLSASFLDDTSAKIDFTTGVYYSYSTKTGDTANGLINPNIYVHPSVQTDAQMNGATVDARLTAKVATAAKAGSAQGLSSNLAFTPLYSGPNSPVGTIRNEELILLKAEALFFTGSVGPAVTELNIVRTLSGKLPALTGTPNQAMFTDELLYERRYSLLFEGGHRWIDLRRFGVLLPLDNPTDVRNIRFPIPLPECNARPGEPRCSLGST